MFGFGFGFGLEEEEVRWRRNGREGSIPGFVGFREIGTVGGGGGFYDCGVVCWKGQGSLMQGMFWGEKDRV